MALTKVTGQVIKNTTDVTVGVLTVTNTLAVGGTVSVGGTLTYEDVTNIDSVGLITARNGIVVGSGITLSKDGDGFFTGVVTATSYAGSGANLTGIDTELDSDTSPQLGGNLDVNTKNIVFGDSGGATDDRLTFGAGTDLSIYHDGSNSYIDEAGTGSLILRASPSVELRKGGGTEKMLYAEPDAQVELYYDNSKKIETSSSGATVTGVLVSDGLDLGDNEYLRLGTGNDFLLGHTGSDSFLRNDVGELYIRSDGIRITNQGNDETYIKCIDDGAVELYYDGT